MADISVSLVKQLRERTGAGMMDCKKALAETQANFEDAVDWLRAKGLAAAAKKAGRTTTEGLVAVSITSDKKAGAVLEINSETDFVARSEAFCAYVKEVSALAHQSDGDIHKLKDTPYGNGRTIAEELTNLIAVIGENLSLRRVATLSVENGYIASYTHAAQVPSMGKIGVLVGLTSDLSPEKLATLGKQIAMHVAANAPQAVSIEALDPATVEHERSILMEQTRSSGKPEDIVTKMVEGRLRKFYEDVVLLEQPFVMDNNRKVKQVIAEAEKGLGGSIVVSNFVRFALGEGIEKHATDFAAEVAAQLRT
ncbi:MAG: translation elongation factor Ts [Holosporales bacterium]|jgi:elongation factor Ts|nr:translation elongation factor Ts [Holosporales bacterium]